MRTTVNIKDEAFELCKRKAQEKGVTVGEVIADAIFSTYRDKPGRAAARRIDLPVSGSGGLCAGVDLDRSAELEDLMEGRP